MGTEGATKTLLPPGFSIVASFCDFQNAFGSPLTALEKSIAEKGNENSPRKGCAARRVTSLENKLSLTKNELTRIKDISSKMAENCEKLRKETYEVVKVTELLEKSRSEVLAF